MGAGPLASNRAYQNTCTSVPPKLPSFYTKGFYDRELKKLRDVFVCLTENETSIMPVVQRVCLAVTEVIFKFSYCTALLCMSFSPHLIFLLYILF